MSTLKITVILVTIILLFSCGRGRPSGDRYQTQTRVFPVIVDEVRLRDLQETFTVSGRMEGIVDIDLISETNGRVVEIYKSMGEYVKKGQKIGQIDNTQHESRLSQAELNLSSAKAAKEAAEISYSAVSELVKIGNASEFEYKQALSAKRNSLAQVEGAKAAFESARLNYENSNLVAPESGYISSLDIRLGQLLTPGMFYGSITEANQIVVRTAVSERYIRNISPGAIVNTLYDNQIYQGTVAGVGLRSSGITSNYPVEIIFNNYKGSLLPGTIADIEIVSQIHKDVIYIDRSTIKTEYDKNFVFVVSEGNVRRVEVFLSKEIAGKVIVDSGLNLGDLLVVQGIENLEDGAEVTIRNQVGEIR